MWRTWRLCRIVGSEESIISLEESKRKGKFPFLTSQIRGNCPVLLSFQGKISTKF